MQQRAARDARDRAGAPVSPGSRRPLRIAMWAEPLTPCSDAPDTTTETAGVRASMPARTYSNAASHRARSCSRCREPSHATGPLVDAARAPSPTSPSGCRLYCAQGPRRHVRVRRPDHDVETEWGAVKLHGPHPPTGIGHSPRMAAYDRGCRCRIGARRTTQRGRGHRPRAVAVPVTGPPAAWRDEAPRTPRRTTVRRRSQRTTDRSNSIRTCPGPGPHRRSKPRPAARRDATVGEAYVAFEVRSLHPRCTMTPSW